MVSIAEFLQSTVDQEKWDYKKSLDLRDIEIHTAPHELLLQNEGDVAIGVTKVEVIMTHTFFGIFGSLVTKYFDNGEIKLMFNTVVSSANTVLIFFDRLKSVLGAGTTFNGIFASFNDTDKVNALSSGRFEEDMDEIMHVWLAGEFTYTLNYKIAPLRQFVFSVACRAKPTLDQTVRKQTLLAITNHRIADVIQQHELSAIPVYEDNKLKYTDYTFLLNPPELEVFDRVRVRIFGAERTLTNVQYHVVYFCKFEIDNAIAIQLCDALVKIYGQDSHGDSALAPHEVDLIEAGRFWSGRNWWMNKAHKLHNFDDPQSSVAYWLLLTANPDEDGFSLHVTGYDQMAELLQNHTNAR